MNTKHTYPTVDLPTGEHLVMSNPPVYQKPTGAWLTKDQEEHVVNLLAGMMGAGLVTSVVGFTQEGQPELAFAMADEHGQPDLTKVVMVVHADGSAETGLPVPGQVEKFYADHPDLAAAVESGDMTYNEALESLEQPAEPVPASALGDYM